MLACSSYTDKEIVRMSLLKTILPFLVNQAAQLCSRGIFDFIFPREFHVAIRWIDLSKIFDETIGDEHNSISLHFCKLWQHLVFSFQSLDVRASENPSDSQVFQSDLL